MLQKTELRPLPYNPTKTELKKMFPKVNHCTLMDEVNAAMKEHRGERFNAHDRILFKPEFEKVIALYGYPKGYEKEFRE